MIKAMRYRGAAALLCVFLTAASLTGCGARYEKITLPEREDKIEETKDGVESAKMEETSGAGIELEDVDGAEAADQAAVADVSALENKKITSSRMAAEADTASLAEEAPADWNGRIVAIDAGHQAKGNPEKEPVGPGSSTMKAKVAAGATGISTKLPEYQLTLAVARKVEDLLKERGYQVVMIRQTNDVNISNAERAKLANESGADIFVRIHANSLDSPGVRGTLSMCQTEKNPYNGELHDQSYRLSRSITDAICAATGFKNRGVQETDTMSGINWCTIPVSIVEMGFMSNPEEDQLMAQEEYQDLIAGGIANGIDAYFN
ncbi:MAG: N-acetylmuramoyl-L-alanine amidase [Clostridiaceae bacterium]|nr:N-acetylmuramoyl-L-alanine amidase [Clostridiaceae bacterium]